MFETHHSRLPRHGTYCCFTKQTLTSRRDEEEKKTQKEKEKGKRRQKEEEDEETWEGTVPNFPYKNAVSWVFISTADYQYVHLIFSNLHTFNRSNNYAVQLRSLSIKLGNRIFSRELSDTEWKYMVIAVFLIY